MDLSRCRSGRFWMVIISTLAFAEQTFGQDPTGDIVKLKAFLVTERSPGCFRNGKGAPAAGPGGMAGPGSRSPEVAARLGLAWRERWRGGVAA